MTQMSQAEKQNFLSQPHIGVLALNNPGQGPLTTPLLQTGARLSLVAQEEKLPYSYVSIEGPVTAIEAATQDSLLAMAKRYLGNEQGQKYADASNVADQIRVLVAPEKWLAVDYSKGS
jgi:hypothetical protein